MIKNLVKFGVASALIAGMALPVFAQTATSASSLIQTLQAQIQALQAQIEALKKAQSQVAQTQQDIKGTLKLILKLKEGSTGDQVTLLQTILAADPQVFPEGFITGFFGRLTREAVKRFQKKHGLDQVGHIGPKTLEKLNKELAKHDLKEEEDEDDEDEDNDRHEKRFCIPPGHLIAPGWLRKIEREGDDRKGGKRGLGNIRDIAIVEPCKKNATSTPPVIPPPPPPADTTAPVISAVSSTTTTATGSKIVWTTNELSDSKVLYSSSTPVAISSTTPMTSVSTMVFAHEVMLSGLTASTTYYYKVSSSDAVSNTATSGEFSFTTQ